MAKMSIHSHKDRLLKSLLGLFLKKAVIEMRLNRGMIVRIDGKIVS